jgi:hypothetical protein
MELDQMCGWKNDYQPTCEMEQEWKYAITILKSNLPTILFETQCYSTLKDITFPTGE